MRPSARLANAVAAERAALERERERLRAEAADLRAALERIERGMAEIDAQCGLLDRLAPPPRHAPVPEKPRPGLRGPAIREAAVRALVADGREALHYREWFELLNHDVAGKDPLAVFLTQLSRSPAVRKGAQPGVYELDRRAPARLRATLDDLHEQLRALTTGTDLTAIRARRARLTAEIGRTEKALEELARVLAPARGLSAAAS
jgi:hypothetical protein